MQAVLRARTLSETRGFMKALVSQDTDEILGFTAVGPQAGEVIAVVQTAMMGNSLIPRCATLRSRARP